MALLFFFLPITRLVTAGTIEEKIFQRQIKKANLDPATSAVALDNLVKLSTAGLKVRN
jgi:SNF2 family DNA or RNA helicase